MTDEEKIEMIDAALRQLYGFLASGCNGVVSVSFNGMSKSVDRKSVLEEIRFLEEEREKTKPRRRNVWTIQLP